MGTGHATLFPLGPEQYNSFTCFYQGKAKATRAFPQNLKPKGPPCAEVGLELQERSPSWCPGTPQARLCQQQCPYLDVCFCSQRAVAGLLHVTALHRVAAMYSIKVGVVEVCVVIQATAVNLRKRERKGWEEHPSGLPPSSNTIWTPLLMEGVTQLNPASVGCSAVTWGPGFYPTHHHKQLSPHQVPSRETEEVVTAQDCDMCPLPSHCPTQTCHLAHVGRIPTHR